MTDFDRLREHITKIGEHLATFAVEAERNATTARHVRANAQHAAETRRQKAAAEHAKISAKVQRAVDNRGDEETRTAAVARVFKLNPHTKAGLNRARYLLKTYDRRRRHQQ